jgi:hypothetical protein
MILKHAKGKNLCPCEICGSWKKTSYVLQYKMYMYEIPKNIYVCKKHLKTLLRAFKKKQKKTSNGGNSNDKKHKNL